MLPPTIKPGETFWVAMDYFMDVEERRVIRVYENTIVAEHGLGSRCYDPDRCFPIRREAVEFCVARLEKVIRELKGSL